MSPTHRIAPVVGAVALAALALAGCSSSSSTGTSTSSSTTSTSTTAPASSDTSTGAAPSVSGSLPTPSIDSQRLTAIAACLKNAGLPTPTSTNPAQATSELVRLVQDPRTLAALKACNIPLPGLASPSS